MLPMLRNFLLFFLTVWFVGTTLYGGRVLYKKWQVLNTSQVKAIWYLHEKEFGGLQRPIVPFVERFTHCENNALRYLRSKRNNRTEVSPLPLDTTVWSKFSMLYSAWPAGLKVFAERYVSHIYMVKDLGASGYVITPDDEHFTIMLDERIIGTTPNDWFTTKEQTIFDAGNSSFTLQHRLQADQQNLPEYTLEAILIHELAHCIGVQQHITRTFDNAMRPAATAGFFAGTFHISKVNYTRNSGFEPLFGTLKYYSGNTLLDADEYMNRVAALRDSPFPTLYSTVNDLEYFAEYFFAYIHCVIQKHPLTYVVKKAGLPVLTADCGIHLAHHNARRDMMDKLLSDLAALEP